MNINIYFGASIRGGRQDAEIYFRMVEHLRRYGKVLTEHIGSSELTESGESLAPTIIHDRDVNLFDSSNVAVFELTNPSLGVGYEVSRGVERNQNGEKFPMLGLFRPSSGKSLSAMIEGCGHVQVARYETLNQALELIDVFFAAL